MIRRRRPELLALHRRLAAKLRPGPARVPTAETSIERAVAAWLSADGLDVLPQHALLPTVTVDFYVPSHQLVIECHGTYFHADPARYAGRRLTAEQHRKRSRDTALVRYVERAGLRLLVLWEEDIRTRPEACRQQLRAACGRGGETGRSTVVRRWTTASGRSFAICQGDLTAERVDAIVNAANERLRHGSGLAAAIVRQGGGAIQDESDAWIATHGRVPTGGVALTSAGSLPARAVIHAVGPSWHGGGQGELELLRHAVANALDLAAEQGFHSVALPAIGAGADGFPKDRCAALLLDAAEDWSAAHPDASLREVRFTNLDQEMTELLVATYEARCDA